MLIAMDSAVPSTSTEVQKAVTFLAPMPRDPRSVEQRRLNYMAYNWGRWGKDDEIGTFNLITPAVRRAAAALVKEGISISLAHSPPRRARTVAVGA